MELVDIISNLDTPAILTVLGFFLYRSDSKLKEREDEIKSLNEYIRLSDKENINTLAEFSKFLESLIANVDSIKGDLAREISLSADGLKNKMDNLRTLIELKNGTS